MRERGNILKWIGTGKKIKEQVLTVLEMIHDLIKY